MMYALLTMSAAISSKAFQRCAAPSPSRHAVHSMQLRSLALKAAPGPVALPEAHPVDRLRSHIHTLV